MTEKSLPPEPKPGTVEWAEWASRIYREDPEAWKLIYAKQKAEWREHSREAFGPLRFVVKPIIVAMATFYWLRDKIRSLRSGGQSRD